MKFLKHFILVITGASKEINAPLEPSDKELIEEIKATNNTLFFTTLYDRYSKKIYNKCFSFVRNEEEAKDLTQEVFLKLFTKLNKFEGKSKFSTWFFSFTYNFCVNYIRDKSRKKEDKLVPIQDHDYYLTTIEDVTDQNLFEMQVSKLKIALENIAPEDKVILLLKYQDDVTVKELIKLYNISESAVKMRLKRARIRVLAEHNKIV